jgi:sugar lactone lactonase YvrE
MTHFEVAVRSEDTLGESPIWCDRTGTLTWVDSRAPSINRWDPSTGSVIRFVAPKLIGSIGFREQGGWIAALQDGLYFVDPDTGSFEAVARPEADLPDNRFNDGRVDRQGRFWAGTMNDRRRDPTGSLYRFDPDRSLSRHLTDIIVPNSLAWSPESERMYFADTYRHRIMSFDFDAASGTLSGERLFADCLGGPGRPDGSAIDEDGCLWNAEYAGSRLVRYTPGGRIDRVIPMPFSNPTCCTFGGLRLETLFVTSARQRLSPEQLALEPLAGSVLALAVGARGLPEPRFLG